MPSHRLSKLNIDDTEIFGYSVAGEESVIAVPSLDVCFDIGKAPEQVIPINNLLLTHGHMDHAAGIAYYLSHRQFCGQAPGNVYAPKALIGPISQIVEAWGQLDGNPISCELNGVSDGDEFKIKSNILGRVFNTAHNRTSIGFSVIEIRKKLKEEYVGLAGYELVELKKKGVQIEERIEIPLVSYLGDTCSHDYSSIDSVAKSKILITECTFFIDEHIDRAKAGKHVHVKSLAKMLEKLDNEYVVLTHFTQRTSLNQAKDYLKKHLPADMLKKIKLLMDWRTNRMEADIDQNAGQ